MNRIEKERERDKGEENLIETKCLLGFLQN